MTATSKPNEIAIHRVYDAPVQVVWDAWTDPAQTALWWGPRGFTTTTHSKDLRVGGHWTYTMHGPDSTDYPNNTRYHEVVPNAKLVYDHGAVDDRPPLFRVTVVFAEIDGKTHMDMTMALDSAEAATNTRKFIKQVGGNSTWDRLAEYLCQRQTSEEKFVINRSFDAPLELMFDMWSKPEHFSRWLAPTGFTMRYIRADIRSGGSSMYCMSGPNVTMYGRAQYEEVRRPDRLVYTQQFCDEHENVTRHPMAPLWPETMRSTVQLTAEGPQCTRVTITWEVVGPVRPEEMAVFIEGRAGMTQGWTGSLDKLEDVLAADTASA